VVSDLHPQHITDFNYSGGTFELAHEGDALIQESLWPLARIPNTLILHCAPALSLDPVVNGPMNFSPFDCILCITSFIFTLYLVLL
jgi:hypothetical protein